MTGEELYQEIMTEVTELRDISSGPSHKIYDAIRVLVLNLHSKGVFDRLDEVGQFHSEVRPADKGPFQDWPICLQCDGWGRYHNLYSGPDQWAFCTQCNGIGRVNPMLSNTRGGRI